MRILAVDMGRTTGLALVNVLPDEIRFYTRLALPGEDLTWVLQQDKETYLVLEDFPIPKSSRYPILWLRMLLREKFLDVQIIRPAVWKQGVKPFKHLIPRRPTQHEWDALALAVYVYSKINYQQIWEVKWRELQSSEVV